MAEFYCGPAPEPHSLLTAWNADPMAIAFTLVLSLAFHRAGSRDTRPFFRASILVLLILYLSPLCAFSVALFSARIVHHAALVGLAAPLLAMAFPGRPGRGLPLSLLVLSQAFLLWVWHYPALYEWGIGSAGPYWLMQLSMLGSAFLLWRQILNSGTETGAALLALLATLIQMGMLGALLVFAARPLYAPHLASTFAYHLTPLADQQLAGLIMWVPASLPFLLAALFLVARRLSPAGVSRS